MTAPTPPTWAEQLAAVSTFLGALGAIATLFLIYRQIRDQRIGVVEGMLERAVQQYYQCRDKLTSLTPHSFVEGDAQGKLLELRQITSTIRDLAVRMPFFVRQLGHERTRVLTADVAKDVEILGSLVMPVLYRMDERGRELLSVKVEEFARAVAARVKDAPGDAEAWLAWAAQLREEDWEVGKGLQSKQNLIARAETLGVDFTDLWQLDRDAMIVSAIRSNLEDVLKHLTKLLKKKSRER